MFDVAKEHVSKSTKNQRDDFPYDDKTVFSSGDMKTTKWKSAALKL